MAVIGKKNKRVVIEEPTVTPDSLGDPVRGWSTFLTLWASVGGIRGQEKFQVHQVIGEVTHRIRINWHPTLRLVTPKFRIRMDDESVSPTTSRYFDIKSVIEIDEGAREFEFMAIERFD